jgi:hypothetical protein
VLRGDLAAPEYAPEPGQGKEKLSSPAEKIFTGTIAMPEKFLSTFLVEF